MEINEQMNWEKQGNEWECEHGVGHKDFEGALNEYKKTSKLWRQHREFQIDLDIIDKQIETVEKEIQCRTIHGCDGCCDRDDFPGVNKEQYIETLLSNCKRFSYDFIDNIDWMVLFSYDKKYINWYKAELLRRR